MSIGIQYSYEPLVSSVDASFDAMYRIYEESIPASERKQKTQISAMTVNPEYKILLLKRDNNVIGFSILFTPTNEMFCLLEYMAIQESHRCMGLGEKFFLKTFKNNVSNGGSTIGLLEVDSERKQSADQKNALRRQQFYRRVGCLRIDGLSYVMPLVGGGTPPQMDILVYIPSQSPTIEKHQFKCWLEVIYSKVYGCSHNDPRIAQMIAPLDDPIKFI